VTSTALVVQDVEVVGVWPSLDELIATANREHHEVMQHGLSMIQHAIRAGEAICALREKVPYGQWEAWVRANLGMSPCSARDYMRVALNRDLLLEENVATLSAGVELLQRRAVTERSAVLPQMKAKASRLLEGGASKREVAEALGVDRATIYRWFNDGALDAAKRRRRERRLAADALKRQQREQAIRRAVRKAGAATAEAWAMAERFQDVLAQAQRETGDREAREALSLAGEHYRKMRDEIVRALGVQ
jgi:excisionase family DNA binding protein